VAPRRGITDFEKGFMFPQQDNESTKSFWAAVHNIEEEIKADILAGNLPWQPETVEVTDLNDPVTYRGVERKSIKRVQFVYITSKRSSFNSGIRKGVVSLASVGFGRVPGVAATRITEGTHEISTREEVEKYLTSQINQLKFHIAQEQKSITRSAQTQRVTENLEELLDNMNTQLNRGKGKPVQTPVKAAA
jgi:hypothetical protein